MCVDARDTVFCVGLGLEKSGSGLSYTRVSSFGLYTVGSESKGLSASEIRRTLLSRAEIAIEGLLCPRHVSSMSYQSAHSGRYGGGPGPVGAAASEKSSTLGLPCGDEGWRVVWSEARVCGLGSGDVVCGFQCRVCVDQWSRLRGCVHERCAPPLEWGGSGGGLFRLGWGAIVPELSIPLGGVYAADVLAGCGVADGEWPRLCC